MCTQFVQIRIFFSFKASDVTIIEIDIILFPFFSIYYVDFFFNVGHEIMNIAKKPLRVLLYLNHDRIFFLLYLPNFVQLSVD